MDPEVEPEFGTPKSERQKNCWKPFGATWAIWGAILGQAATPEESPNQLFLNNILKKVKMEAQKRYPQNMICVSFFIEFRMDFGLIFDVFLIPLPFAHATFNPSKTFVFPMNFNDFTLRRNMILDDFPDLFRYQF
jgi:hypothetical protein